jgi:ubiquinone/menaquinone biosynthesis C-methylase UbiE
VRAEDADGRLATLLRSLLPGGARWILDVGAGTGRISRLLGASLAPEACVVAADLAAPMLAHARRTSAWRPEAGGAQAWLPIVADARRMPVRSGAFDAVFAGWVYGHVCEWGGETWRAGLARAIGEAARVVRKGGLIAVIDTLGTGVTAPRAPSPLLADYHAALEAAGFALEVVRTDYRFGSLDEAVHLTGFFFGSEMGEWVRVAGVARVPECTGVWSVVPT